MAKWTKKVAMLGLSVGLMGTTLLPNIAYGKGTVMSKAEFKLEQKQADWIKNKKGSEKTDAYSKDTLVIKYDKPLTVSDHRRAGTTLVKNVSSLNYAVVKINKNSDMNRALSAYQMNQNVLSVSPSALLTTQSTNDPKVSQSYHLPLLQIEKAQKLAGNNKVTVAVIDQGVDGNHPELKGQLLPSYNTVNPLNQGLADYHGTHVSGIIAAKKNNGIGAYGINPNVKILPIDVFNRNWGASDFTIAEAILYAVEKGAKVINMSLGSSYHSPIIEDAVKVAISKNVTIVASAGNTGDDSANYPASLEGVISVGSTNKDNKLSSYSTYGSSVDLVAPGEAVYAPIYEADRNISFRELSGTSMASPVVAGVASLLLSKHPKLKPAEIEYILKHTAKDLGAKGYDTKYGHGLVNPVAALNFDIKKIPASVKEAKTEKEVLAAAKAVTLKSNKYSTTGKMTKANQTHWIKFNVTKGEHIQAILNGAKLYDYQMKVHLYSKDDKQTYTVNQVKEGKAEGKMLKIPFDGVLAIGVKDTNNNYDDTGKGLSNYQLQVERAAEIMEDGNDLTNVAFVSEFPFKQTGLTFTGDDGDEDYFKVSVEERQMVKVKTTGVPGLDQTINVYPADMLMVPGEPMPTEGQNLAPQNDQPLPEPMFMGNKYGTSEGEELVFEAMPGMEYIVTVTNKRNPYYYWYYPNMNVKVEPSLIPYTVDITNRSIPADEDNWPPNDEPMPEEKYEEGKIDGQEYANMKIAQRANVPFAEKVESQSEEQQWMRRLMESARPFDLNGKAEGFLQGQGDEDWFKVTPTKTGVYQFNLGGKEEDWPLIYVYKVQEYENEKGEIEKYFQYIAHNYDWGWWDVIAKPNFYAGLEKGQEYYISATPMNGKLSFNNYSLTAKMLVSNPHDKYEDNNTFEKAKDLPSTTVTGNFAMTNDTDIFYYKSKASGLVGVSIGGEKLSKEKAAKYPQELQGDVYAYAVVIEDTNKNKKLDDEELNKITYIDQGIFNGRSTGAFQAKKGKNYFVVANGFVDSMTNLSLNPYKLTVKPAMKKDEDAGSVVKKYKPSKPLKFKKVNSKKWTATGYLNPGVDYGDEDWYELKLDKAQKVTITFSAKSEIDGLISIYQNGKRLKTANYYPEGDAEIMTMSLKKGTYYIKVKDVHGNASIDPYKLTVDFQ